MTTVWIVHVTDPYEYGSGRIEGVYTNQESAAQHVAQRGFGDIEIQHWQVHDTYNPGNPTWELD